MSGSDNDFTHPGALPVWANDRSISHPPHYNVGGMECIDVIEALDLPYHLGNVMKYVFRAGRKGEAEKVRDLMKARWYLNRYIQRYCGAQQEEP